MLHELKIGNPPEVIEFGANYFIKEWTDGELARTYFNKVLKQVAERPQIIQELLCIFKSIAMARLYVSDLHPRNIILNSQNKWVIIDSKVVKKRSRIRTLMRYEKKLIRVFFRMKTLPLKIRLYCWVIRLRFLLQTSFIR